MTRNRDYYYPTPWMKPDHLSPGGDNFTMTGVDDEIVGRDEILKAAVGFEETDKKLLLSPTQYDAIVRLTGHDDVDQWPGVRLKLVPITITIKNKKAGTEEDVRTIQILPASPIVAGDQQGKPPTLRRKHDQMNDSSERLVAAAQKSPDNSHDSPFAA
jgi:hypothetical protein